MAIEHLKKAAKPPASGEDETREIVADMLAAIELWARTRLANTGQNWTVGMAISWSALMPSLWRPKRFPIS